MQSAGDKKFADYKPKTAFLFPGQGAQTVGMAKVIIYRLCSSWVLSVRAIEGFAIQIALTMPIETMLLAQCPFPSFSLLMVLQS